MLRQWKDAAVHCLKCGRLDSSLRFCVFAWVFSLVVFSSKRAAVGVWCNECRRSVGIKYSLLAFLLGPWGFPWGIIWTLEALRNNLSGGAQPEDANGALLRATGGELLDRGQRVEAVRAFEASLQFEDDPQVHAVLWSLDVAKFSDASPSSPAPIGQIVAESKMFHPGQSVRGRNAPLYHEPGATATAGHLLGDQTAIVTAVRGPWVQLIVTGVGEFWSSADHLDVMQH